MSGKIGQRFTAHNHLRKLSLKLITRKLVLQEKLLLKKKFCSFNELQRKRCSFNELEHYERKNGRWSIIALRLSLSCWRETRVKWCQRRSYNTLTPKISHQNLHSLENNSASSSTIANELISIAKILPLVITGVFLYFRSFISMFFLRRLGDASFAGGSMALAFSNISGYSVFSGLTMGVESICSHKRYKLVRATIRRGIILLLVTSLPISLLWINIEKILKMFKQDKIIASKAHTFMLYSVPDLIVQSFLHPLRAYLRTQSKTLPLSICTAIASVLHLPITYFLESYFNLGIKSIALSGVISNFNLVAFLFEEKLSNNEKEEEEVSDESCGDSWREWKNLLSLAIPICISTCLQLWWCYEIMILMCGFLINPKATVAS